MVAKTFRESLPDACPPTEATTKGYSQAFRLILGSKAVDKHFDSHCALGKPCPPGQSVCRWSSCSLFDSKESAFRQIKLPKIRKRFSHFAILEIASGSGYSTIRNGHIDFWMFSTFKPVDAVIGVEKI